MKGRIMPLIWILLAYLDRWINPPIAEPPAPAGPTVIPPWDEWTPEQLDEWLDARWTRAISLMAERRRGAAQPAFA